MGGKVTDAHVRAMLRELALLGLLRVQPLTTARAATIVGVSRHSTQRSVDRLVRDGHVVGLKNGRRTYLRVTPLGVSRMASLKRLCDEAARLGLYTPDAPNSLEVEV